MVGATGIEPVTPSVSGRCSPAELRARSSDLTCLARLVVPLQDRIIEQNELQTPQTIRRWVCLRSAAGD